MENWWDYRLWAFAADMNADGAVSISDVWLWFKWLYFMPGDLLVAVFGPTGIGRFLELTVSSFGGTGSGILSFILWMVVWLGVLGALEESNG